MELTKSKKGEYEPGLSVVKVYNKDGSVQGIYGKIVNPGAYIKACWVNDGKKAICLGIADENGDI